ncbi:hypothetical protein ENSA5_32540 [Enhygromyxa salina]|uniref:EGF-like domain-containing protein n=1 Tax=Enhygromyxa salina TaxID=215803 RepID=A0A2S9XXW2_9BACT|nr:hypothetical protein [Enhygromyxa salina]PRP97561.1 hypothetical protein ENSA5_32540 [Enhygromyxa salina]
MTRTRSLLLTALVGFVPGLVLGGCYSGFDVEDKQPPAGFPGGKCLGSVCNQGVECIVDEQVCVDLVDPCKGIYCGGNGACGVDLDTSLPFCTCNPGYTNEMYAYFCTATSGL